MPMGAHEATMLVRAAKRLLILALINILAPSIVATLGATSDVDALLRFKNAIGNNEDLKSWNEYLNPCRWNRANWIGVLCLNGTIWGLQLEHMELKGTIDVDSLASLPDFRTLSLMDNKFTGPLPEIKKLKKLKALYLSNNLFSGTIPDDAFEGMGSLKRLYLANNMFTGNIPLSITTLPKLTELRLEGNQFHGLIPDFQQKGLRSVYVASNDFEGPIPPSLSHLNPNSFSGNKELCGLPLDPCVIPAPTNAPVAPAHKQSSNISRLNIILIVIVVLLTLAVLTIATFYKKKNHTQFERSSSELENSNKIAPSHNGDPAPSDTMSVSSHARRADVGKLSFLKDDIEKFDLQDLLRASAEVLGSGTFGASYKAVMKGQALVVKRYRHMNNVGREEFNEHMRRIGRLKHPNLLPLAAYYYRREEKLLVSEFVDNGSLASHLHGNHSMEDQGLDWLTRLKIIKGVARGLSYLYSELPIIVPHGHLKSSNVLLDESYEPLLTDYALRPVINTEHAHLLMTAYKSPEYAQQGRSSKKTDIWSFGILILELLTGKFPENYLTPGYDRNADLATWVNSMVKEKRTGEVFDKEMSGTKNSKGEMIKLLKIGLSCCEEDVERRLDIKEVVKQVEQLKEGDHEEFRTGNEGNAFSRVRSISEGDFSSTLDR